MIKFIFMVVSFLLAIFLIWYGNVLFGVIFAVAGIFLFDLGLFAKIKVEDFSDIKNEKMTNNHDSNRQITDLLDVIIKDNGIEGRIIKGKYKGKTFKSMGESGLISLYEVCKIVDTDSAVLLEVYLNKYFPNWKNYKEQGGQKNNNSYSEMLKDAYEWFDLKEGCSEDDLKKSYKRVVMKAHPDQGGSTKHFQTIRDSYELLLNHIRGG